MMSISQQEQQVIDQALSILNSHLKNKPYQFNSSHQVKNYLRLKLELQERELFMVLFLDSKHRLIESQVLFSGTIDRAHVHSREVVKAALLCNAAAVIIAHNHPSGDPEPSIADISMTKKLKEALSLVDVRTLDHLIIGHDHVVSLSEQSLI